MRDPHQEYYDLPTPRVKDYSPWDLDIILVCPFCKEGGANTRVDTMTVVLSSGEGKMVTVEDGRIWTTDKVTSLGTLTRHTIALEMSCEYCGGVCAIEFLQSHGVTYLSTRVLRECSDRLRYVPKLRSAADGCPRCGAEGSVTQHWTHPEPGSKGDVGYTCEKIERL